MKKPHVITCGQGQAGASGSGRSAIAIPHTNGTVVRLLSRDNSAWIALDERLDLDVHPFPETDDARHTHVLAWPEDCEPTREVAR